VSRILQALRRAAEERREWEKGTGAGSGRNGELSRAMCDSFSAAIPPGPQSNAEPPSAGGRQTTSPDSPWQACKPPSRSVKFPNGFRPLNLSVREGSRLVLETDPHGLAAEQFRLLRQTLSQEFSAGAVLLITSPGMGDGKTLTSVNLCTCLADAGDSTLFVEADVRRPKAREILNSGIEPPGLEDAWAGKAEPGEVVHWINALNLHAAMVAKIPKDPSHVISGSRVKRFVTWARERFRWVVLDAAPVLPTADVPQLLPFADAVLLVIRAQSSPRELTKRAIEMLGKGLRGVILNEVTVESNPHYRYLGYTDQRWYARSVQDGSDTRSEK
jgi:capsular exopolysaccharide synthesis family protein